MTIEQLETAMLIQAGAFVLLAAALVALSVFVIRLVVTLESLRRQLNRLLPSPSPAPRLVGPPRPAPSTPLRTRLM